MLLDLGLSASDVDVSYISLPAGTSARSMPMYSKS